MAASTPTLRYPGQQTACDSPDNVVHSNTSIPFILSNSWRLDHALTLTPADQGLYPSNFTERT